LKTGDLFNAEFGYHVIPKKYDLFDDKAFEQNPMEFYAVCTDVETGLPVYKKLEESTHLTYDWIRASASMPLASKVVELEGMKVLDGGVADSIPLKFFESIGYGRNVVILTQPEGYVKEHNRLMPLMRIALKKYPKMIEALDQRHIMYNRQLEYVRQAEQEGRCIVIRPDDKLPIGHISHDPEEMQRVYELGRDTGLRNIDRLNEFYQ
jgi:predicted patatin/cPLA2 family phospholipase